VRHLLFLFIILGLTTHTPAQDTHYAGDAFLLGAGARAMGLGGAYVAVSDDATAFYWNPAGHALHHKKELHAQHTEQFGGSVNHDIIALGIPFRQGGLGLAITRLGVDNISFTQLEDPTRPLGPDNRPVATQTVGTTDTALNLSYAHTLKAAIKLGITVKFIRRDLDVGTGSGFGIDVGLLYQLRPQLRMGLVIRDLTKTQIQYDAGQKDPISPSIRMGASYVYAISTDHQVLTSVSGLFGHHTSGIEDQDILQFGLEYQYRHRLMFRFGFQGSHFTAGTGVRFNRGTIDLAFLENGQLNNTYRLSTSIFF